MPSGRSLKAWTYAASVAVTLCGCRSGEDSFSQRDAELLSRIYTSGNASFDQQAIIARVQSRGVLKLAAHGRLRLRQGEGPPTAIVVPVCSREPIVLADPIVITSDNVVLDGDPVEIGLDGGVRCLTVALTLPSALPAQPGTSGDVRPLSIEMSLASAAFESSAGILIPTGQGRGVVNVALTLPTGADVTQAEIQRVPATLPITMTAVADAEVPDSVRLVSTFEAGEPGLLDMSSVTFSTRGPVRQALRRWRGIVMTAALICLFVSGLLLTRLNKRRIVEGLHDQYRRRLTGILEFNELVRRSEGEWPHQAASERARMQDDRHRLLDQYVSDRDRLSNSPAWKRPLVYARLGHWPATAALVFAALFVVLVLAAAAVVAPVHNQDTQAVAVPATLAEFEMKLDGSSLDRNAVPVSAKFYALVDRAGASGAFGIRAGRQSVSISDVEMTTTGGTAYRPSMASASSVAVDVPGTSASFMAFATLQAAGAGGPGDIRPVQVGNQYFDAIHGGRLIQADLIFSGVVHHRRWVATDLLHWFPLESASVEVPFSFSNSIVLTHAALVKQRNRYSTLSVYPLQLHETHRDDLLLLSSAVPSQRFVIPANSSIVVSATSRRSRLQQLWLLLGVPLVLLASYAGLRYFAVLPDKHPLRTIISSLGVLGLPASIYAVVAAREPELPNPFAGEPATIFDVVYGLVFLTLAAALVFEFSARRRRTSAKS